MGNRFKNLTSGGCLAAVFFALVGCTSTEEVKTDYGTSFERKGEDGKWAYVYSGYHSPDGPAGGYRSEAVYDRFEKLGMADVPDAEALYVLYAGGKKYLFQARTAELMLEGNPFSRVAKDNGGFLYAETPVGLYPLNGNRGLPDKVSTIYRSGALLDGVSQLVIYSAAGKYGAYIYEAEESKSVFSDPKYSYRQVVPPVYDRIIHVFGGGASHFVAFQGDTVKIIDPKGRVRTMGRDESTFLKGYYQFTGGFWAQSVRPAMGRYLTVIRGIPLGTEGKRVADLRSYCTHTGGQQASTITITPFTNDNYDGPFFPSHGDGGLADLD